MYIGPSPSGNERGTPRVTGTFAGAAGCGAGGTAGCWFGAGAAGCGAGGCWVAGGTAGGWFAGGGADCVEALGSTWPGAALLV